MRLYHLGVDELRTRLRRLEREPRSRAGKLVRRAGGERTQLQLHL